MLDTENSQVPCAEDINFDSLEYLFGAASKAAPEAEVPWVDIEAESESTTREAQLQVAIRILQKQNHEHLNHINTLYILIGYMQAHLHEKDEQLKLLPDLRFKAAESVAWRLESERVKEKAEELQKEITRLSQIKDHNLEEKVKKAYIQVTNEELVSTLLPWLALLAVSMILGFVYLSS